MPNLLQSGHPWEAVALRLEDIDLDQGAVTIQHLKSRIKLACPGCGAALGRSHAFCARCGAAVTTLLSRRQEQRRMRTLPLDNETMQMMRDYIGEMAATLHIGKGTVFGINRHRAWQIVSQCAARAELPTLVNPETGRAHGVSPHRLRDAFAVHAMKTDDSGDGMRLLQEHLGHASFNTTAKYRKVAGDEHRAWYNKLWSRRTA